MEKVIEMQDTAVHIGDVAAEAIKTIDATRKEFAMSTVSRNAAMTPMDMLNHAVSQGAGIEVLEKLMGLQERWEANQSRKAFDAAISKAKAEITPIVKNATGHNSRRYADFAAIARAVDPILARHGLSYRFKTSTADRITVTCVLSHEEGHSEETTLSGPADASGSKNAIQAIGSTLTYLQRYSLTAALGLAAANDDDGVSGGAGETITEEQARILQNELDKVDGDIVKFCAYFKIDALVDLPLSKFKLALDTIRQSAKRAS